MLNIRALVGIHQLEASEALECHLVIDQRSSVLCVIPTMRLRNVVVSSKGFAKTFGV